MGNQSVNAIPIGKWYKKFAPPSTCRRWHVADSLGLILLEPSTRSRIVWKCLKRIVSNAPPDVRRQRKPFSADDARPDNAVVKRKNLVDRNLERPFHHRARGSRKVAFLCIAPDELIRSEVIAELAIGRHDVRIIAITGSFRPNFAVEEGKAGCLK